MTWDSEFELPWPPSVNCYWSSYVMGRKVCRYISARGKKFRRDVRDALILQDAAEVRGNIEVLIEAYVPDRRKHDLDNICKAPLDALVYFEMIDDDSKIDALHVVRMGRIKGGKLVVHIREYKTGDTDG